MSWIFDPLNARFGEDWNRLTKDLLFTEDGSLAYKPHLWTDVRKVIVPQLVERIGYVVSTYTLLLSRRRGSDGPGHLL